MCPSHLYPKYIKIIVFSKIQLVSETSLCLYQVDSGNQYNQTTHLNKCLALCDVSPYSLQAIECTMINKNKYTSSTLWICGNCNTKSILMCYSGLYGTAKDWCLLVFCCSRTNVLHIPIFLHLFGYGWSIVMLLQLFECFMIYPSQNVQKYLQRGLHV